MVKASPSSHALADFSAAAVLSSLAPSTASRSTTCSLTALRIDAALPPISIEASPTGQTSPATPKIANKTCSLRRAQLVSAMTDQGILLHPTLEKHVDTDFNVGEVTPSQPASAIPSAAVSAVPSAAASVSGDDAENADLNIAAADAVPKIVACGKGGALYLPAIFSKVIELSGQAEPNIVYIGTASFDADKNYRRHSSEFASRGCEVRRLDVSEPSTVPSLAEMRQLVVDWADVLVCSGGNTLHALLRWKETGLDLLMKEAAEQGTVLCGGSAGAGCWFSSMHSDSLRPDNVKHAAEVREVLDDDELEDWVSCTMHVVRLVVQYDSMDGLDTHVVCLFLLCLSRPTFPPIDAYNISNLIFRPPVRTTCTFAHAFILSAGLR